MKTGDGRFLDPVGTARQCFGWSVLRITAPNGGNEASPRTRGERKHRAGIAHVGLLGVTYADRGCVGYFDARSAVTVGVGTFPPRIHACLILSNKSIDSLAFRLSA